MAWTLIGILVGWTVLILCACWVHHGICRMRQDCEYRAFVQRRLHEVCRDTKDAA